MTFSSALAVSELASMKKLLFRLLYVTGITTFAAWWNRKRLAILCYHGVTERPGQSPEDAKGLHVNRTRFERHLNFLQSKYNLISLQEYLIARETRERLPKYSAVLTFGDGFRNFLTVAAPLLVKRRIPAIIYLITDNAANGNGARNAEWTPEDDRTYLSWSEARMLKEKYGFEFGSH